MKFVQGLRQKQKEIKLNYKRIASVVALFALFLMPTSALATPEEDALNQIYQQIYSLKGQLAQTKTTSNTLAGQVSFYNAQIYQIQLEVNATQYQIDDTAKRLQETTTKIAEAEAGLAKARSEIASIIQTSYEEGQQSNIEVIIKSKSFSELMDRTTYLETIQLKIKETSDKIIELKNQLNLEKDSLDTQQKKLVALKEEQQVSQYAIIAKRAEQQALLSQSKGTEAGYQAAIKSKSEDAERLRNAIEAAGRSGGGGSYGSGLVPQYFQTDYPSTYLNGTSSSVKYFGCGVASIAMLLSSYGYHQTPATIATNPNYFDYGTDLIQWSNIPRATGYRFRIEGNPYAADIYKANTWASAGKPFIVWIQNAFGPRANHFVVIVGGSANNWIMNDPVRGGGLRFNNYYSMGQVIQTEFITP